MDFNDQIVIDQAHSLGDSLGREAAYQRTVSDSEDCLDLYTNDYEDWLATYRPQYGPLSGKGGGLTEYQIRRELGLTDSREADLLDSVLDAFEEGFFGGWDEEIMSTAREELEAA
jgi:hypothetical protein